MAGVNYRQLRLEISNQAGRVLLPKIKPLIQQEFDSRKEVMLEAFDQHPVTTELKEGAADPAGTRSNYVETAKGGNLFTFFGFHEGDDPTIPLRDILDKDVKLNLSQTTRTTVGSKILFKTPVRIPNLDTVANKIAEQAPVPWQPTRGFTQMLENTVAGFGHYLFDAMRRFKTSRSGPAIQIDANLRGGSIRRTKYISEILGNFKKSITGS